MIIIDSDDFTICSYFIFRLTALLSSAVAVDHCTAHINRIYIFSQVLGRGENEIFSRDIEQESEKEEKKTGRKRMFVDILWRACDGHDISEYL